MLDKTNMAIMFGLLCLVAVGMVLVPTVQANASGFQLNVNLYDGKTNSGTVKVVVISEATNVKKERSLDVGRIVVATHNSNIELLVFGFSDRELPPNGAFSACVVSVHGSQCEQAERHHDASSAIIWVQVPN
jgi:hypothetical protein